MNIKKAVIPVAGLGTRFLPITKSIPKEMLPIVDKPILQYIVEEAYDSGIEEILFITNSNKKCIEDYFDKNYELEEKLKQSNKFNLLNEIQNNYNKVKIFYTRQSDTLGSGYAISLAKEFVKDEMFAVMYGDDLMYSNDVPVLKQLIDIAKLNNCSVIGCMEIEPKLSNRYGMLKFNNKMITDIIEKPKQEEAPTNLAGLGRYILKPSIFNYLDNISMVNGEYRLTDAMTNMMKNEKFLPCVIKGKYYDIGSKDGYLKANIEYALMRDDMKNDIQKIIKDLKT